ncbi:MAG: isoprenylcysteine carboxylmethyltransferase family protein [Deltaproteobacteria bacterium]|nr:isoprenylcysteine carboxylmethyltransferase family protein [Deltaproteobacteria bacterium]
MNRWEERDDLTGEHTLTDAGQLIFACLFFAIWTADTFWLKYTTFLNPYLPFFVRIAIGAVLLIISGYLAQRGMSIVFGETRAEPYVIRKSVFGIVRHPIYLSEILLYLGCLVMSMSLAAAVVWIMAILFLHYVSRHEEKLLLTRFGEEYAQYMREVPMWIPRLRKKG